MKYELSFIISALVPENEHPAIQQDILSYLEKIGAKLDKKFDSIGRKKLAYPIKKQKHGFYMFLRFELEDKRGLKDLDSRIRHNANILRHLIIKLDELALRLKIRKPRPLPSAVLKPKPATPTAANQPGVFPPKPRISLDLDDIDKQLDKILEKDPTD